MPKAHGGPLGRRCSRAEDQWSSSIIASRDELVVAEHIIGETVDHHALHDELGTLPVPCRSPQKIYAHKKIRDIR